LSCKPFGQPDKASRIKACRIKVIRIKASRIKQSPMFFSRAVGDCVFFCLLPPENSGFLPFCLAVSFFLRYFALNLFIL